MDNSASMVNRCAVIVKPKPPFFEWLRTIAEQVEVSAEGYNTDSTVYLLPDMEMSEDADVLVEHYATTLFERLLGEWSTAEKEWPDVRSREVFDEWSHCEFHSLVIDLVTEEPLELESCSF